MKEIAEKYFLQKELDKKISFIAQSARGFMHDAIADKRSYDIILVDAYIGTSIPEELVTKEFFSDLLQLSNGVILNMIMDTEMQTDFALHVMATLSAAWPNGVWYKNVSDDPETRRMSNFIIASRPFAGAEKYTSENTKNPYTDNRHSIEIDKAKMFYQP